MKNMDMENRGVLDDRQIVAELVDAIDPAIGETSAAIGAMTTEIIRRTLRAGVLQVGREVSQFTGEEVRKHILEQQPTIEKAAAITATEVARDEVQAVRLAANEQGQRLAERIDDVSRQTQEQTQTVARELLGRLEESSRIANEQTQTAARNLVTQIEENSKKVEERTESATRELKSQLEETARQTNQKIEVVARTADDTARQTTESAAQLSRTLEAEVSRTLESSRKELNEQVEILRERARGAAAKFVERLDKHEEFTAQIVAEQITQKKELIDTMQTQHEQLVQEVERLRRANEALLKRVEILEEPRGLRAFFARLFGWNKRQPVETASE
jgi:hypothetical protein